jgi:hypothetical protein
MTTLAIQTWKTARSTPLVSRFPWRLGVLAVVVALVATDGPVGAAARTALSDAYLAVTVFVAGTLFLVQGVERGLGVDLGAVMVRRRAWAVPMAALLGAFPGCGGAIVVTTQYTKGRASLGALVATLTATMGDAAFLLLARDPAMAAVVIGLGLGAGTAMGFVVDWLHPNPPRPEISSSVAEARTEDERPASPWATRIWLALLVPGAVAGGLLSFQIEPDVILGFPIDWGLTEMLGILGSLFVLVLWAMGPRATAPAGSVVGPVMKDTNFVAVWVIGGFLAYEVTVAAPGVDLASWFRTAAPVMPLVGVAVGLLPGCGPQIVVTALYLNGLVPFSALLGNALSNDGDALFPAIAMAPRAAALATAYSAAPAVALAYGAYALGY